MSKAVIAGRLRQQLILDLITECLISILIFGVKRFVATYHTEKSTGYAEDEFSGLDVPIQGKHSSASTNDARL